MAQTEKYMLLEKEEMQRQKRLSLEAMLQSVLGGASSRSPGRPAERPSTVFTSSLDGSAGAFGGAVAGDPLTATDDRGRPEPRQAGREGLLSGCHDYRGRLSPVLENTKTCTA